MLQDLLYSVEDMSATAGTARVRLLPDSPIYAAHFKGMPVTPGACLVQMACELVSTAYGNKLDVAEASDIRFVQPVFPTEITGLTFAISRPFPIDQPDLWSVQVLSGETLCARMKLTLKP